MSKIIVSATVVILSVKLCFARFTEEDKQKTIKNWLITDAIELHMPAFNTIEDFSGNPFDLKNLLQENQIDFCKLIPKESDKLNWNEAELTWSRKKVNSKDFISLPNKENQLYYLVSYLNTDQWSKIELSLKSHPMIEVMVKSNYRNTNTNQIKQKNPIKV